MTDCYNYAKTNTSSSAKYVHTSRHIPQVVMLQACQAYAALLGEPIQEGVEVWNHRIANHGEYISTLVHQLLGAFDLTAHGYQGIEHAKDEFGNEKTGAASRLDEFYTCIGGVRQSRY